jgi:DNA-directed RNA polymerase subunit RPC12/RpoP
MGKNYKTYDIRCGQCGTHVLTYHKHGAGKGILRLYLDNIAGPESLLDQLRGDVQRVNQLPNLECPECGSVMGTPTVSKGQRWAFRMRQGYFHRKWIRK